MAFTTGTTVGFSGATGLLQSLIAYIAGATYPDALGTGDGITMVFSKTVANTPIALGQCRIRFKIAGVIYQAWDNGLGVFVHTKISTGTIVYATGAINITFTNAPDNLYVMGIIYCLSTNGAGRDWIILRDTTSKTNTGAEAFPSDNPREYIIKNSGPSYVEEIYIGLREFKYVAGTHYGIQLNIYKTWRDVEEAAVSPWNANSADTGYGYDGTRQNYTACPGMPLNETNMAYWIFSSKRRIMVVARVSGTIYEAFYAGGTKRFSSPSKYPHPYIIMGTVGDAATTFSSTASTHNFFIWPVQVPGCFMCLLPNDTYDKGTNVTFYPKRDFGSGLGTLKKTPTNKIILYPVYAIQRAVAPYQLLFELDGPFFTPFTSLAAEDILEIAADDYLIVPNIFRTTYQDYMGLLEA